MTQTSKTILFFGTEDFSLTVLKALIEAGFTIGAVITKPDARRGRSHHDTEPAIKKYAREHHIPVWQPAKLAEITAQITAFDKPVGVLVSYGKIIPQSVIDLFDPGIINVHPSLLPRYRGPTPIESAIINGDSETGVSIMRLSAQMDAGPVYSRVSRPLTGTETKPELYQTLAAAGAAELVRVLPAILDGTLLPTPQDDEIATYCHLLSKADTLVDATTLSATDLERRIRAHRNFPKTRLQLHGQPVIVTKARVTTTASPHTVTCKNTTFLEIEELVAESGKTMSAESYLRGRLS